MESFLLFWFKKNWQRQESPKDILHHVLKSKFQEMEFYLIIPILWDFFSFYCTEFIWQHKLLLTLKIKFFLM